MSAHFLRDVLLPAAMEDAWRDLSPEARIKYVSRVYKSLNRNPKKLPESFVKAITSNEPLY